MIKMIKIKYKSSVLVTNNSIMNSNLLNKNNKYSFCVKNAAAKAIIIGNDINAGIFSLFLKNNLIEKVKIELDITNTNGIINIQKLIDNEKDNEKVNKEYNKNTNNSYPICSTKLKIFN